MSIAILVPVLKRPGNVEPLLASIDAATTGPYQVVFIADPTDLEEQRAVPRQDNVTLMLVQGNYAAKINAGVRATDEPYVVLAADDLRARPGWFEAAVAEIEDGAHVVGLNDLIPRPHRPEHATHFLLSREYAERPTIDGGRGPACELYGHWRTDDELIATARHRGVYRYCAEAVLEHINHPMIGGADDETYRKGRATARRDNRTFRRREHLWR